jgi:hypothetical protein
MAGDSNNAYSLISITKLTFKNCHELSQSRYESHVEWATTCTIGSSKYKNLKLREEEKGSRGSSLQLDLYNLLQVTCRFRSVIPS